MIVTLSLLLVLSTSPLPGATAPEDGAARVLADEFDDRYAAAKDDVDALWTLHEWCVEQGLEKKKSPKVLKRILKLEPEHTRAHEALGHIRHDGEWFESQKKLDAHLKKEEERLAKERGWVKWKDRWVPPEDLPKLEKGLVKSEDGQWMTPEDLEKLEAGWGRQDLVWISPEEAEKVEQGLWKCGEEWLTLAQADAYHASPRTWWVIPSAHFVLHTTLPREKALVAIAHMEDAFRDLVQLLGVIPSQPLHAALFSTLDQYKEFGANGFFGEGDPLGYSGSFGAYPALNWLELEPRRFHGGGVGYWDTKSSDGDAFGPFHARFAAGFSFVEAIDGSREVVDKWESGKSGSFDIEGYLSGRFLPEWLRFGVASCAGRYWTDLAPGKDKEWVRRWSTENIARQGGLDEVEKILAFEVRLDSASGQRDAGKLINEAGLLFAFTLHGEDAELREAHAALKDALKKGVERDVQKAVRDFEKELLKRDQELRAYARI
jgi:hypothetical protein